VPPAWRAHARGGRFELPLDGASLHAFLTAVSSEEARRMVRLVGRGVGEQQQQHPFYLCLYPPNKLKPNATPNA
jgi:hypothetical protein